MDTKRYVSIFVLRVIPKALISRAFGRLARMRLPRGILLRVIDWYCGKYGVNRGEIAWPPGGFPTLDQFFIRKLKEGVHVIDGARNSVVSPVDSRVDRYGAIDGLRMIQAKGIDYSLRDLIPSEAYKYFIGGSFITLYLSPADYHRIHSPVNGRVAGFFHAPGLLFPVKDFVVKGVKGLFARNERLVTYISTPRGMVAVCKIGALNVGRITLSYHDTVTNRAFRKKREFFYPSGGGPSVAKGDELGIFHLGSTVILLFPRDVLRFEKLEAGQKVRLGQRIATFVKQG